MSFPDVDLLIALRSLKSKVTTWRILTISLLFLLIVLFIKKDTITKHSGNWIARVKIEGIITENDYRNSLMRTLRDNKNCSAVIIHVNSPGGSVVGSEIVYNDIKYIAKNKPVIISMGTIAASGGYLLSLASNRIFAYEGTLTGSIGVILNSMEFTNLFDKIGIKPLVVKKPELKAVPSPFEKITPKGLSSLEDVISDTYNYFLSLIEENRHIPRQQLLQIADGRVYTARQALELNLIDQIGDEHDILEWLKKNHQIDQPVQDFSIKNKSLLSSIAINKKVSTFIKKYKDRYVGLQAIYTGTI